MHIARGLTWFSYLGLFVHVQGVSTDLGYHGTFSNRIGIYAGAAVPLANSRDPSPDSLLSQ